MVQKRLRLVEFVMTLKCIFDFQKRSVHGVGSVVLTALLCLTSPAMAHRVTIFPWEEGGMIHTKSKFSGGRTVKEGKVIVSDLHGNHILDGKTDNLGEFTFKAPENTGLKIVLQAGMGHMAEWTMPGPEPHEAEPKGKSEPPSAVGLSSDEMERAIEKAIERELRPVIRILVEDRNRGPSIKDIVGGIGYILGLMGIAAYFHYRRKMKEMP